MGWFQHDNLTEAEASELVERYNANRIRTEKSLSADFKSWTVSALLPESARPPKTERTWQQRFWRDA
jgi:hypothetical protein